MIGIKRRKFLFPALFGLLVIFLLSLSLVATRISPSIKEHPVVRHFTHFYVSIKKLPDIVFIPYQFAPSKLDRYEIQIPLKNIAEMNSYLSDDPIYGKLREENQIFVNANFNHKEYNSDIDIRYRGLGTVHWNRLKKSLRLKFPKNNYFEGQRLLTLVIPQDRAYLIEPLNMYRADKLGLNSLDMKFTGLNINGRDMGVYLTFEHWSKEWLAKKGLPETPLYRMENIETSDIYNPSYYKNISDDTDQENEQLVAFYNIIHDTDDETFKSLIPLVLDMEKFYSWDVLNILAASSHQSEAGDNAVLYFNGNTGKFEMIPWDTLINDASEYAYPEASSLLRKRILSIDEFRERRDELLAEYVLNEDNLKDDLGFYDNLLSLVKSDFLKDNVKLETSFQFLRAVKDYRDIVERNYFAARDLLNTSLKYSHTPRRPLILPESFRQINKLAYNQFQFLRENPYFYKIDDGSIGLSGSLVLNKNLYIPKDQKLIVSPGSRIFLGPDVSIVSYSPVELNGSAINPIYISNLIDDKPWGSFLILNHSGNTKIEHVNISGGSEARINGIYTTGMLAVHGGTVTVTNSVFSDAHGDDALNIKGANTLVKNNMFRDNSSDGFDIDFSLPESEISNNRFVNSGGDAIDLSYSEVLVKENHIENCADKGVSVGEDSQVEILDNSISGCNMGVAVKDLSVANIISNFISHNETGIAAYRKKPEFGGGTANASGNNIVDNSFAINSDKYSTINIK